MPFNDLTVLVDYFTELFKVVPGDCNYRPYEYGEQECSYHPRQKMNGLMTYGPA